MIEIHLPTEYKHVWDKLSAFRFEVTCDRKDRDYYIEIYIQLYAQMMGWTE